MTIGLDMGLYFDAVGVGQDVWVLAEEVGDVNNADSYNTSQRKVRRKKFEGTVLGQRVVETTFTLTYVENDPVYELLRAAYEAKSIIGVAAMTGLIATSGSEGLQYDGKVASFPMGQPLEEDGTYDVVIKPAAEADDPVYVEVA